MKHLAMPEHNRLSRCGLPLHHAKGPTAHAERSTGRRYRTFRRASRATGTIPCETRPLNEASKGIAPVGPFTRR